MRVVPGGGMKGQSVWNVWATFCTFQGILREGKRETETNRENLCLLTLLFYLLYSKGDWEIGEGKGYRKRIKKIYSCSRSSLTLICSIYLRPPDSEEEMTFSGFDPSSSIGSIPLFISIIPWEPSSCSCHNSVFTEGLTFRPRGCGKWQ